MTTFVPDTYVDFNCFSPYVYRFRHCRLNAIDDLAGSLFDIESSKAPQTWSMSPYIALKYRKNIAAGGLGGVGDRKYQSYASSRQT